MYPINRSLPTIPADAVYILHSHAVVKPRLALVRIVSQAVPLRGYLGVESPDVVVDDARGLADEGLREYVAGEEGFLGLRVERPV